MTNSFTNIFGGQVVNPAYLSYIQYSLTALIPQIQLSWPTEFVNTANNVSCIVEVTASAGGYSLIMPSALNVSVGQAVLFVNVGANTVTIYKNDGVTVLFAIAPGVSEYAYIIDNATANGSWRLIPWGGGFAAVVSVAAVTAAGTTASNLTISGSPITSAGTFTFTLAGELLALGALNTTGIVTRTGASTYALRTIGGTTNQIVLTNGNGVAGNPTIALAMNISGITSITASNIQIGVSGTNTITTVDTNPLIVNQDLSIATGHLLRIYDTANTKYAALKGPAAYTNNVTYTMPADAPAVSGYALTSTVGGLMSWGPLVQVAQSICGNNMILNGDMQVWQRGAGGAAIIAVPASTTAYTVDRWQLQTGANQACTVTQYLSSTLPSGRVLTLVQRNNGQTGTTAINFITSLTRAMSAGAAGQSITVSFLAAPGANFSAAGSILTVTLMTGTGSSDSSALGGWTGAASTSTNVVLTGSLVEYSYTFPAIGATVTQLALKFSWIPVGTAGVNDNYGITDIKMELGTTATNFERRGFNEVLAQCLPFYWKTFPYATAPATATGVYVGAIDYSMQVANVAYNATISYPAPMRISPTIAYFNPVSANTKWYNSNAAADSGTPSTAAASGAAQLSIGNATVAGDTAAHQLFIHATADAELT